MDLNILIAYDAVADMGCISLLNFFRLISITITG